MNPTDTITPTRRRYSDQEQADALATLDACDGNISEASRVLGIPHETIRAWVAGLRRPAIPHLVDASKAALAERYDRIVSKLLDVCEDPDKLDKMSAAAAMLAACQGTDKALLLRGEATTITSTADDERSAALKNRYTRLHKVTDATTVIPKPPEPSDDGTNGGNTDKPSESCELEGG